MIGSFLATGFGLHSEIYVSVESPRKSGSMLHPQEEPDGASYGTSSNKIRKFMNPANFHPPSKLSSARFYKHSEKGCYGFVSSRSKASVKTPTLLMLTWASFDSPAQMIQEPRSQISQFEPESANVQEVFGIIQELYRKDLY